jgi:hypothetical protein
MNELGANRKTLQSAGIPGTIHSFSDGSGVVSEGSFPSLFFISS